VLRPGCLTCVVRDLTLVERVVISLIASEMAADSKEKNRFNGNYFEDLESIAGSG